MKYILYFTFIGLVEISCVKNRQPGCYKDYENGHGNPYCWNGMSLFFFKLSDSTHPLPCASNTLLLVPRNDIGGFMLNLSVDGNYVPVKDYHLLNECLWSVMMTREDTFKITCNRDFDSTHKAGSDLSEFFSVKIRGFENYYYNTTVTNFRDSMYNSSKKITSVNFYFLKLPPKDGQMFKFNFTLTQSKTPYKKLVVGSSSLWVI